tara:strand:- start:2686 stop:3513 length:828 start_codon:yes stop_codon:yes gene_type:complete
MLKQRDNWQREFEKQIGIAERRNLPKIKKFYKTEYKKGVDSFLSMNQTNFDVLFNVTTLSKLYRDLYQDIGMQFAKWYARHFDKYISKGVNPNQYESFWMDRFAYFGSIIAAQRVTLVSNTAKQTLIALTQRLMSDPEFMMMSYVEQARILNSRFGQYSLMQALRLIRTEGTNIANYATMQSAQSIFPASQLKKEWIASFDDRTRDTHAEADGQIVMQADPFLVGGEQLLYPGDPAGSSTNVINCRCSVAPFPVENAETNVSIENIGFGLAGLLT